MKGNHNSITMVTTRGTKKKMNLKKKITKVRERRGKMLLQDLLLRNEKKLASVMSELRQMKASRDEAKLGRSSACSCGGPRRQRLLP